MLKEQFHIASVSFGKDSVAMLLMLIEKGYPVDEVMFYDTGMEFESIYHVRDQLLPILKKNNIKFVTLKPEQPFLYNMLERPVSSKQKGNHFGYGWCGGLCRWGTSEKLKALDKYAKDREALVYIGLASDEPERVARLDSYKTAPLAEWNITEAEALEYCWKHGIHWKESSSVPELYNLLDRVSCWCCCNKNQKELYNIWKYLPNYWNRLLELQDKLERPVNYPSPKGNGLASTL